MLDQKTVTLGQDQFVIQQLPATKGLEAACKLGRFFAGAARGLGELPGDALEANVNIGQIVEGLLSRLDEREVPAFLKALVRESLIRPAYTEELFETRFSGAYGELLSLIYEILELNYADSIQALKKRVRAGIGGLFLGSAPTSATPSPS